MVNFATTMACVIVISSSVKKRQRNQSVKQRNGVLAFRDSGFWRIRVNLPPPLPTVRYRTVGNVRWACQLPPTLREVSVGHAPDHVNRVFGWVIRKLGLGGHTNGFIAAIKPFV